MVKNENSRHSLYRSFDKIVLLTILLITFISCGQPETTSCEDSEGLYTLATFPIGVAINYQEFTSNPVHVSIADRQFNSFTAENIFKPAYLHPEAETFYWQDADALVAYCQSHNKRLHGHTLIWHNQLPLWITEYQGGNDDFEQMFKKHIQTIVLHFKGRIASWDVVNEAFNEDGTLRNSIWRQKLGDSYIEKAFIYAHEADPCASLFYNDYNLESNITKRNSVLQYFNNIRIRNIQVDGIGLQMHVSLENPETTQIGEAFQAVTQQGFKLHLSELDISTHPLELSENMLERQADYLGKIVYHYQQIPAQYQYGITFWGLSDKDSWIRSFYNRVDYPLLYDDDYQIKPMYCKFKEVI
jgi:endo-1,4-beta-xylanase